MRLKGSLGEIGLAVFVVVIMTFLLGSIVVVVGISFNPTDSLAFPPRGFSTKWYSEVLGSSLYLNAFATSVLLAAFAAIGATLLGVAAAYGMARFRFAGREVLSTLFNSPLALPGILTGVSLLEFFTILRVSGSFFSLVIAHILITLPYTIRMVGAGLSGLDPSMEEAARSLGAGRLTTFSQVSFPIIRPAIAAGALFAYIVSFDNITISLFLTTGNLMTIPVYLYQAMQSAQDPSIAAISVFFVVIAAALVLGLQKLVGLDFVMK